MCEGYSAERERVWVKPKQWTGEGAIDGGGANLSSRSRKGTRGKKRGNVGGLSRGCMKCRIGGWPLICRPSDHN